MSEHRFDRDTAVLRRGESDFELEIVDERWWVVRGPNGGFVAAAILRAMTEAVDDPERVPRSLTVHYPGAPRIGTLRIAVTVERVGRTVATVSARATQGERLIALALAAFSSSFPGADFQTARMPQVPGPEQVEPATMPGAPPFTENFEYRFTHGGRPFEGREEAVTGGWLRLREPRVLDAPLAAAYADAWIPAVFQRLDAMAVAPTIDLTVHFREALPMAGAAPDDFVLGVFRSVRARDGLWEEDGELWSADGRLLVQSRQLAALMTQP